MKLDFFGHPGVSFVDIKEKENPIVTDKRNSDEPINNLEALNEFDRRKAEEEKL